MRVLPLAWHAGLTWNSVRGDDDLGIQLAAYSCLPHHTLHLD